MNYKGNSSYLHAAFEKPEIMVAKATKVLEGVDFDTMIGTGLSGALVVPLIARAMNKAFAIVRKENDSSHRERAIEGTIGDRWIFVDDFVSSGATLNRVKEHVKNAQGGQPYGWDAFATEFAGTYQYARDSFVSPASNYF